MKLVLKDSLRMPLDQVLHNIAPTGGGVLPHIEGQSFFDVLQRMDIYLHQPHIWTDKLTEFFGADLP
jgi:hypothetical protein